MKYQNINNGIIGEVVNQNEKFKTVTLSLDNGVVKDYSIATIKRHWKKIEENPEESTTTEYSEVTEQPATEQPEVTVGADDICDDGRSYSEIGKEIAEQAKAKAKEAKAKKAKKDAPKSSKKPAVKSDPDAMQPNIDWVTSLVKSYGDEVFVPNACKVFTFKVEGHMYCRFSYSSKRMTLAVKSEAVKDAGVRTPDSTINHMFNTGYAYFDLDDNSKAEIDTILKAARNFRLEKTSKSSKKTKKEEN